MEEVLPPPHTTYEDLEKQYEGHNFLRHKEYLQQLLVILQENRHRTLNILTESPTRRYLIYTLCRHFGIRYKRIEERGERHFECSDFPPFSPEDTLVHNCGCHNVPDRWNKYSTGLDYDDLYRQYTVPWVYKRGVSVFYDIPKRDYIDESKSISFVQ